jgi:DNA-binding transcriptional LysR family regulator
MDRLEQMEVFVAVVECGSFTGASERIATSRANISKHIAALEGRLKVRVLNRTTRRVSLTEVGRTYYERCRRILAEVEEADHAANSDDHDVSGELRVVTPVNFGRSKVGEAVVAFLIKYPKIRLDLRLNDRRVDPIEAGYDIAVRIGGGVYNSSPNLGLCRISTSNRILCAAPEYLSANGCPRLPDELTSHECLSYSYVDEPQIWRLSKNAKEYAIPVSGRVVTSSGPVLNAAAVHGLGIAYGPQNFFNDDLQAGRLTRVLPDFQVPQFAIWSTFPMGKYPSAKVTAFNEFMMRYMKQVGSDDMGTSVQQG